MTYSEFKGKYLGVKCGNTVENMGECVGLVSLWQDNLNIPHEWGNAKDLLTNANPQYFDIIYNDPKDLNQFPVQGDIMVFGASWGGGFGHTGIVDEATGKDFILFEQNNPEGNPPELIGHRSYSGVLGWLRPKVLPAGQSTLDACLIQHTELVNKLNAIDAFRVALTKSLNVEGSDWQRILDETNKLINSENDNQTQANLADRLWDALTKQTGIETVKYTPESEKALLAGLQGLPEIVPEGVTQISTEELDQLKAAKTLDKFNTPELIREVIKRVFKV